jgi:HK97 family phage portal protein
MKFLEGLFETKAVDKARDAVAHATAASPSAQFGGFGIGQVGNWDIEKAVTQGLEKVVWVYRCCDVIATNQANLMLGQRKGGGMNRQAGDWVEDPIFWNMMNMKANDYERAWQFRYRLTINALLSRRGVFIERIPGALGRTAQVHILPSQSVLPIPHITKFVEGYRVQRADGTYDVLPPERVLWLKLKPHPTDPYAQMTPLMSAGISAETDWLAHVFNRNFLANDGRPGLLISIQGNINPVDAAEIKARFSGGPMRAGQASVIEADGVDIADMSSTPRDLQWSDMMNVSKEEILLAFGVPESVMGNASGRTFDNADAERENFWMDTVVPHCDAIAAGLDPLTISTTDDILAAFDYSQVDVLQRAKRVRLQAKQAEFTAGLATIDEYMKEAGKEEWNVPLTRVLILPTGIGIGKNDADQKAIEEAVQKAKAVPAPGEDPNASAFPALPSAPEPAPLDVNTFDNVLSSRLSQLRGGTVRQIESAPSARGLTRRGERRAASGRATSPVYADSDFKSLMNGEDIVDAEIVEDEGKTHPYLGLRHRMEGLIEGVITGWDERQEKVVTERLMHVKMRKGTRHWDGEQETKELKALDPKYAVEVDQWARELQSTLGKTLHTVILREARSAARDVSSTGVLDQMVKDGTIHTGTGDPLSHLFGTQRDADAALGVVYSQVDHIITTAAKNQSRRVQDVIARMDAEGKSMRQIEAAVRKMIGTRAQWRKDLAVNVVTSAVESARAVVYGKTGTYFTKTWNSEHDERTRHTHLAADGQTKPAHMPFIVGKARLMAPGDPTGPVEEVINCRCWSEFHPSEQFYNTAI